MCSFYDTFLALLHNPSMTSDEGLATSRLYAHRGMAILNEYLTGWRRRASDSIGLIQEKLGSLRPLIGRRRQRNLSMDVGNS